MKDEREDVASAIHGINEAWLAGRVQDLAAMVHDEIVRHPPQSGWLDELGRLKGGWRLLPGFPQSAPWFQSVSSYLPTWSGTSKPLPKTH